MVNIDYRGDLANGQFRFTSKYAPEQLVEIAEGLKDGPDGDPQFVELAVRQYARGRYAIAFLYQYDGDQRNFKKFLNKMVDSMGRRFGDDVRLDIANGLWRIQ